MKSPALCIATALVAALLLPACRSVEQKAPPVAGLRPPDLDQCEEGRRLYLTACIECHRPRDVRSRTITEWRAEVLPRMARKAHLQPHQEAAVLAYLSAVLDTPSARRGVRAPEAPGTALDSFAW